MKHAKAFRLGAIAAPLIVLATAVPAYAQINGSADMNGGAGINAATGVDANLNANVGADAGGGGASSSSSARAAAATRVRAAVPNAVNAAAAGAANMSATATNAAYNTFNGGVASGTASSSANEFVITRQDVAATSTGYIAPTSVLTQADFAMYARGLMLSDQNVSKIAASDSQVKIWYREPAKILGIIPATAAVETTVDASGNVTVAYPWWYGLFVKDSTQAQFQSDLNDTAGTIARGEATTTLSSMAKARLVNALQSILKNRYDATSGTSTNETTAY